MMEQCDNNNNNDSASKRIKDANYNAPLIVFDKHMNGIKDNLMSYSLYVKGGFFKNNYSIKA